MPVTVKFRWYFLVCGILQKSAPCFHVTNATKQWRIVEIEFLATVGWKPDCQNVTHCRKEICSTCLFKESIPAIPFGSWQHPVPTRSLRFLRAVVRSAISAFWLHHVHPFVAAVGKGPVSCREAEGLVAELFSPRFVTIQWLCSQLCYVTAANQWTIVEIELLATVGWKWDCQPFSCRCTQTGTDCRKWICSTFLFKESIPAIPFSSSQHQVPGRNLRFLRAEVRSISSRL